MFFERNFNEISTHTFARVFPLTKSFQFNQRFRLFLSSFYNSMKCPRKMLLKNSMKNSLKNHKRIFDTLSLVGILSSLTKIDQKNSMATKNHSLYDGQTDQYRAAKHKKSTYYTAFRKNTQS
jgi:hypothetical protein